MTPARITAGLAVICFTAGGACAATQKVTNPIAVFAGLDKITGNIFSFEVPVETSKRFGTLAVRPHVCYSRPPTEEPKTTSFVEIDDNTLDGRIVRVFTGWMLAESPGLNALEHPVYDVWLTGCRDPGAPQGAQEEQVPEVDTDDEAVPKDTD